MKTYKDGEPCLHRGCAHHVRTPCEGCGRREAGGEAAMGGAIFVRKEESDAGKTSSLRESAVPADALAEIP